MDESEKDNGKSSALGESRSIFQRLKNAKLKKLEKNQSKESDVNLSEKNESLLKKHPTDNRKNSKKENSKSVEPKTKTNKKAAVKNIMDGAELVRLGITRLPYLVEPILPKVGLAALIGTSDIGKSTILLQLCCDIVLNKRFLGFKINTVHKSIIYVSTEDDQYSISNRLQRLKESDDSKLKNLRFIFDTVNLFEKLDSELGKQGADLVVIDTFADIYSDEMNQINQVRNFLMDYQNLLIKYNCAIIFNHHTGKHTEERPPSKHNSIGSAGFEGKARIVIELRQDYNDVSKRHFCIVKGNYLGPEFKNKSFELDFNQTTLVFKNTGRRRDFDSLAKPKNKRVITDRNNEKDIIIRLVKKGRSGRHITEVLKRLGFKIEKSTVANYINKLAVQ